MATQRFVLVVDQRGQAIFPKALRDLLGLKVGNRMTITAGNDGRAELLTVKAALAYQPDADRPANAE